MDVLNEKELFKETVSPAITQLNRETVPVLKAALDELINQAAERVKAQLTNSLLQLRVAVDESVKDVQATIRMLDGAELSMKSFTLQLTVSDMDLKLTIPKREAERE